MNAAALGRQLLESASCVSLVLLLTIGGARKNVPLLWLSSILVTWKAARVVTEQVSEAWLHEQLDSALTPLHSQIYDLTEQVASLDNHNALLKDAGEKLFEIGQRLEAEKHELQAHLDAAQQERDRLTCQQIECNSTIAKLEAELTELDLINERLKVGRDAIASVWQEKLHFKDSEYRKLEFRLDEAKRTYESKLKEAFEGEDDARAELAQAKAAIAILKDEIDRLHAPKRLTETAWYKEFCNAVCDWISEQGFAVDLLRAIEQEGVLSLTIRPHRLSDLPLIETLRDKLYYHFEMPVKPQFNTGTHETTIHIYDKKKVKEHKFYEPDEHWFETLLIREKNGRKTTLHGRFVGESESGKSTVLANAIGCVKQFIPGLELRIADPLFHIGDSDWKGNPVNFKTSAECHQGLLDFYALFRARKDGESPKTHTIVFVLDEFDTMMSDYPELKQITKDLWKQGRHAETYLWVSGQSPLVGDFGLRRDDIQNCFGIYLGTTIPRSFADCFITGEESVRWSYEYSERRKAGEKYLAFVRPKFENAFMTQTPLPGSYAGQALQAVAETSSQPQIEGRSLEFDLDAKRRELEALANLGSEQLETVRIQELAGQGKKVHEIIYELWGLKPSSSKAYKAKKTIVSQVLADDRQSS